MLPFDYWVDWRHYQWAIMLCGWSIIHYGFYYWFKHNYILFICFRLSKKMTNLSNFNNWFNKFAFAESHFLFMWCDDMIMHFCFFWKNLWFVMTESLLSTPGLVNSSPSVSVHQHYQPGQEESFLFPVCKFPGPIVCQISVNCRVGVGVNFT